jgi:hypothetical protein
VWAVWGNHEGTVRDDMIDIILGFIVSMNILALGHLYFKVNGIAKTIEEGIENVEVEIPSLDSLKDELAETVLGVLGQMHTPTFMDHIGGAIGGLIHARTARMMEGMQPSLEEGVQIQN